MKSKPETAAVDSRALELARLEEERRVKEDRDRKNKQQMEQEQKFREKMRIEQRHSGPENLKKTRPKKLVKSNNSI